MTAAGLRWFVARYEDQFGTTRAHRVDLRRLRRQPLVANIRRAKRVLGVEQPSTIYVIVTDDTLGDQPEARIYVSNKFNESGYLATSFDGRVLRSFPFEG